MLQNFFFFRFSVTIFSFLDFSSNIYIFFSFFFLLESNVMNTVLDPVSVCFVKRNILVPVYFDVPFQGVSGFLKKIRNNILFKNLLSNSDLSRDVNCVAGEYLFCNSRFVISGGSRNFSQSVLGWACSVTIFFL